jgi:hypothetical protein
LSGLPRAAGAIFIVMTGCAAVAIGCLDGENPTPPPVAFDAALFDTGAPVTRVDGSVDGDIVPIDASADTSTDAASDADANTKDATAVGKATGALVSGGTVSASPNYKLIGTVGQGPGTNGVTSSPSYKLHGGVTGATQKP